MRLTAVLVVPKSIPKFMGLMILGQVWLATSGAKSWQGFQKVKSLSAAHEPHVAGIVLTVEVDSATVEAD